MKKVYVKPTISFESFKMSSNIAAPCDVNLEELQDRLGFDAFTAEASCLVQGNDGDWDICYHGPESNPKVFGS